MKTASILTVSLIFVAFNGVACLFNRDNAIKELREYIEQMKSCSEHDPNGDKLREMLSKFGLEGVILDTCGHSGGPSIHLYYILWRFAFNKNPLMLAEKVLKDLSLRTAIDELKKKYLDKHKKPDEQALFKLLGDFTKKGLISEEKVNYYKKELGDGSYSDANELAKKVLKDLRYHKAIEDLKDFQIEYGLGMEKANGLRLYGLFQKFKVQELISLNKFKEYEKKFQDGEEVTRIACAALTHLKTELSKSEGVFYRLTAIEALEEYIEKAKPNPRYDLNRGILFAKLRKFREEDVISKQQIDSYEVKKRSVWYPVPEALARKIISDIRLQMAIDELEKYLEANKKPDKNALFKLLGDFKKKGVIKEEKLKNYEKLLQDGTCSDANNLAKKVLKDLRIQKAMDELEEFQENFLDQLKEPEEKPDKKELSELFNKFKRQDLISGENYQKYERMLAGTDYTSKWVNGNLAQIACAARTDLTPNRADWARDCK